ncbi:MAG: hypothetical protein LBJ67_18980 [Planctomycetaceae bacterium]|jgi:hypothetical protein|nr:hypothetical protein [Planctomycetaceae bacterium]
MTSKILFVLAICLGVLSRSFVLSQDKQAEYLQISGVYPHLASHNQPPDISDAKVRNSHGESGIGAVVVWAGKLWYITYPQHQIRGGFDKLYEINPNMSLTIRSESVGGTHAARMIHKESNQLIIGPYFIDANGNVRACDLQKLVGRMTAVTQHLQSPETMVYYYDMEGMIYEVNVNTLDVNKLFNKPFPGWHGKGAYTAQNRVVFANNGESGGAYKELIVGGAVRNNEEAGVLAEWDGRKTFNIVERKQFTDVTGPGGIYGSPNDKSPLWAMGWDKNSVILKLLDGGKWFTFRLPKASHTFDHRHGWYTEWPRIREYAPERLMMIQHGSMFDFPKTFSAANTAGIRPMAVHLRYIPDVTHWQGKIVLAADEAAMMENPMCGQAQSNLWFGTADELKRFGSPSGWGGVWKNDVVKAGKPSDPFGIGGYEQRILHVKHDAAELVRFTVELDEKGDGNWRNVHEIEVKHQYAYWIIPPEIHGEWIRLTADKNCTATAYFHCFTPRETNTKEQEIFESLAELKGINAPPSQMGKTNGMSLYPFVSGLIRPAARNQSLQWQITSVDGKPDNTYYEVEINAENPKELQFIDRKTSGATDTEIQFVSEVCKIDNTTKNAEVTDLPYAVKVTDLNGKSYLLPHVQHSTDAGNCLNRTIREVQSERWLANIAGTFYEIPRAEDNRSPDFSKMKPVASHNKQITDFCSWRGLLVLSGTKTNAKHDGHFFGDQQGRGLWFGQIDDLWKLGKPQGCGRLRDMTETIKAGEMSLPYLTTNYDSKRLKIVHGAATSVTFRFECDFDHSGEFVKAFEYAVQPKETFQITLPVGFHAHWMRVAADKDCQAMVEVEYR